ncbi:hypothetical protein GLOTRDRAFT_69734 [Gloeophyllum trabeum ATCC 11539]|uniref:Uncharacterized protein n=1 Tax=Gloeophyllum trabeum (strain ATCC 11539 / FP-39264 / Madison 617) TaxID=670483 RepID=S7S5R1_GLOTA|nr:uncharacterized protein GLOTRDRAFT_69734 [Gloeophyllum trabeum ATCC 11539]EPQ61349.1 hypothetical protein GLOTRDRAFT_69734 [Gloeophyllum trabeum ATCC 11539]
MQTRAYARGRKLVSGITLRTLDVTRLLPEDFVTLSGKTLFHMQALDAPSSLRVHKLHYYHSRRECIHIPFPEGTQGFLYWHVEPNAPPLLSEIRFRVTASSDPAAFSDGYDLQRPNGRIWRRTLFDIADHANHAPFRAVLLRDGLVTQDLFDDILAWANNNGNLKPGDTSHLIWRFGQPFPARVETGLTRVWLLGSSECHVFMVRNLFGRSVRRERHKGRCLLQLERSPLPEHQGKRVVVMRIVKILELTRAEGAALDHDGSLPREGGLAYVPSPGGRSKVTPWIPWSVDIDGGRNPKKQAFREALRVLFDNEAKYPDPVQ